MITTIVIFTVIYLLLLVAWARLVSSYVKKGPQLDPDDAPTAAADGAGTAKAASDTVAAATGKGTEGSVA